MVKDIGTCLFQSNCLSTCSRFVPPVLYLSGQSFFLFVCLSVPPSVHQYLCLCLPVCPYVRLSHTDCPAVYLFAFLTSLCLSVCLSIVMYQYIPCSSAPTTLDIMLVKIGLTVDLKRPSTGAARKRYITLSEIIKYA